MSKIFKLKNRKDINDSSDYRYIFRRVQNQTPGFIEIYQNQCRIYLDEYSRTETTTSNIK